MLYVLEARPSTGYTIHDKRFIFPAVHFRIPCMLLFVSKILLGGLLFSRSFFFLSDMSRISSYRRRELTAHFEWIAAQSIEFIQTTPFTFSDLFFWMKNKKQKSYNRSSGRERTTKICFCVCVSGDDVYPTAA
jgi:hypothetical protein